MLYIGVDLGTSAVKLLLMDAEGRIRRRLFPENIPCLFRTRAGLAESGGLVEREP